MAKAATKEPATEVASEDHRVRVGAERREKTRLRLLETALAVFTEKGPDAAVIDDFIAAAGVSRGTFYNHFRTTNELLLALATAMSDEVLQIVDPLVLHLDDPVQRFAAGTRLYMRMALRYPLWGSFITQVGPRIASRGQLIDVYLTRDLEAAKKSRRLNVENVRVARDLVLGTIFYGIETMLTEPTLENHPEQMLRHILIGLGLDAKEAEAIAYMPLEIAGEVKGPIFSGLPANKRGPRSSSGTKKTGSASALKLG